MNGTQLIEPERHAVWIVAGFVLGLVALALCAVALYRIDVVAANTGAQIVFLNSKIEQMKSDQAKAAVPAPAPAQQAPAAAAPTK